MCVCVSVPVSVSVSVSHCRVAAGQVTLFEKSFTGVFLLERRLPENVDHRELYLLLALELALCNIGLFLTCNGTHKAPQVIEGAAALGGMGTRMEGEWRTGTRGIECYHDYPVSSPEPQVSLYSRRLPFRHI